MEAPWWLTRVPLIASGVWMIVTAYGGWQAILDPATYDSSWRRLLAPVITTAILAGVDSANHGDSLPVALIIAAVGVAACALSSAAMMTVAKQSRDRALREKDRLSPSA